jgi:hypothetical protein
MRKAFIILLYLESPEPEKLAESAIPAYTAIKTNGGRFIVRVLPSHA